MAEQLEESVDNIKKNREELKKAIDISDGKEMQLKKEKK
jgi:hypothetical protein